MEGRPGPAGRIAIVAAYTLVFWVVLPAGLWLLGLSVDRWLGGSVAPSWLGAPIATLGLWLGVGGIAALWTRGRGWPITALPPPRLVVSGPYRFVRHPIYLGFTLALAGAGWMAGSAGVAFVVAPLFVPIWVVYALLEERGLRRRFGPAYARYAARVGLFGRPSVRPLMYVVRALGIVRVRVRGRHHVPRRGPAVIVINHLTYADPLFASIATPRRVYMIATAEVYRQKGVFGVLTRLWPAFPVRRYVPDVRAVRELHAILEGGEVVGVFPERERSVLGDYLGADPIVARTVARLGVPVIPLGLNGTYAAGPRWAGTMRFPRVTARFGPPIDWGEGDPGPTLDRAVRAVLTEDPQRVYLEREPLEHLSRAVWRCPACLEEEGWRPADLACRCGARWTPSGDGLVRGADGSTCTFAEWAAPVWRAPERGPLEVVAALFRERAVVGPIEALDDLGETTLTASPDGLRFGDVVLPLDAIRTVSIEGPEVLQVATSDAMWQLRTGSMSAFRLRNALEQWGWRPPVPRSAPNREARPPPEAILGFLRPLPVTGMAVGAGIAVAEGLLVVHPLLDGFGSAGVAAEVLPALAAYAAVGAVAELALRPLTRSRWAAGGAALAVAVLVAVVSGQVLAAAALALSVAALWAVVVHARRLWWVAVAVALAALSPVLPRPAPPLADRPTNAARGPSIAVVVLDTVRLDRTSLGRADRDTTPHLAALAARGTSFDRAYSTSCWSLPAHATLLTGLGPSGHGAHYEHLRLRADVPVLPAALRAAGYDTAAFSANPLVAPGTGLGRGFVTFEEPWRQYTLREALFAWRVWHRFAAPDRDKGGRDVVDGLRAWLDDGPGRPWFVLVNLMEAHAPYQEVPNGSRRLWAADLSDAELERIGELSHMAQVFGTGVPEDAVGATSDLVDGATRAADAYLGEVLDLLGDDVVVIVVSDHGELFGEHGLWGHNLGLYEPLVRVPMVIAGPGVDVQRVAAPVSLADVAPTALDLAGVARWPSEGVSLAPVLSGGSADPDRVVRAAHLRTDWLTSGWQVLDPLGDHVEVRARRAMAVAHDTKRVVAETGTDDGFDLHADPGEERPFDGERTGLQVVLPDADQTAPLDPDPAAARALDALGYQR